jgi:23S rRNA pseudouridine2605 synthase
MKERLQKILARAGYGSRRAAETLITDGRVRVNGTTVTQLGSQADADRDAITVDGKTIAVVSQHAYLAMHKPAGAVTTANDPQGRMTVMSLLPKNLPPHVLPIGRLDRDTEGLLLFTNDGEFAHRLTHPRYNVEKEYLALVSGAPSSEALDKLRSGVDIGEHVTAPAVVDLVPPPEGHQLRDGHTWLRLVVHEGRKRQIRLMCAAIKHDVRTLVRTRIGDVRLTGLPKMKTRPLAATELAALRSLVGLDSE